jgi:hypothetical protein
VSADGVRTGSSASCDSNLASSSSASRPPPGPGLCGARPNPLSFNRDSKRAGSIDGRPAPGRERARGDLAASFQIIAAVELLPSDVMHGRESAGSPSFAFTLARLNWRRFFRSPKTYPPRRLRSRRLAEHASGPPGHCDPGHFWTKSAGQILKVPWGQHHYYRRFRAMADFHDVVVALDQIDAPSSQWGHNRLFALRSISSSN